MKKALWAAVAALALGFAPQPASAQLSDDMLKVGVLTDMSSLYADINGPGAVYAAQLAIQDFGGSVLGKKIEFVQADVQNKADIGTSIAGKWYDAEKVDVILGAAASSSSLAVAGVAGDKKRVFLATDPASSDLTGKSCNPYTIHYVYDTAALANGTGSAVVKAGGKTWYFLTADYAFGHALERDTAGFVKDAGGKVLGGSRVPINNSDFSAFLLQAQGSGAKVIGLANAGGDFINSVKQAAEFGVTRSGTRLAALLAVIHDFRSLGLKAAGGLVVTDFGYWDMNDETRAFSKRFMERHGTPPNFIHLSDYGATMHYLKAIQAAGTDEAKAVVKKMKEMPVNDMVVKNGQIREDGRLSRDAWLVQVKTPEESKGPWDFYKILATIPAAEVIRPLDKGECPLVAKKG